MQKTQMNSDKAAMTISLVCVLHCFFVPSFVIFGSGFLSLTFDNELVHYIIILIALPVSIFALYTGYKNHKSISPLPYGIFGLMILIAAVLLGEEIIGELGEQVLTLLGATLVAFAHYQNYQLCKSLECVSCHD